MKKRTRVLMWVAAALLAGAGMTGMPACAADAPFVFGLLMVGPVNDQGWSQSHFEGGRTVEQQVPGTRMIYIDKVNPADRPGVTIPMLVDGMVEKGARLIIANSDDMKVGTRQAALLHPDVYFLHISGDDALTGKAPKNLANLMGRMEYGQMMGGFAAAMATRTGKIGYLGPLINEETRRLAASTYLGARYAWETVLKKNPAELTFKVNWIGFWFNIPGVTADPSAVAAAFFDTGFDVVVSGLDTTEALVVADQKRQTGKAVWAVPYEYEGACQGAPAACLGVPYFNWGPDYTSFVTAAMKGQWKSQWVWAAPDWADINRKSTSAVGFTVGDGLDARGRAALADFIAGLGSGRIDPFTGPLNYQDGSVFLKPGKKATDRQIWTMEQLLEGMQGQSRDQ